MLTNYSYSFSIFRLGLYKNYDASSFIINNVGVQIDKQVNSVITELTQIAGQSYVSTDRPQVPCDESKHIREVDTYVVITAVMCCL